MQKRFDCDYNDLSVSPFCFLFPETHAILKSLGKVATVANGLNDFLIFKLNMANLKLSILFRALKGEGLITFYPLFERG